MPLFQKNIISNQVIKLKSDKLHRRVLKDARKKMKKGELVDAHSLALYLPTIDDMYTHLKADINNATRIIDYSNVRAKKVAETRQLIDFFSQDYRELDRLSEIAAKKAEEAGRTDDHKHEKLSSIDLTKLKESFEGLMRKDKDS